MDLKIILKSHTPKAEKRIPCEYSISTICTFGGIENKHNVCRGEDYIKKFSKSLREHAMEIFNFLKYKNDTINKKTSRNCIKS